MDKQTAIIELKKFKKNSGMSYDQLAKALKVHGTTVAFWFQGRSHPGLMACQLIESFLKKEARRTK
jgi:DNA-binding transcriptional regulator YiaG